MISLLGLGRTFSSRRAQPGERSIEVSPRQTCCPSCPDVRAGQYVSPASLVEWYGLIPLRKSPVGEDAEVLVAAGPLDEEQAKEPLELVA